MNTHPRCVFKQRWHLAEDDVDVHCCEVFAYKARVLAKLGKVLAVHLDMARVRETKDDTPATNARRTVAAQANTVITHLGLICASTFAITSEAGESAVQLLHPLQSMHERPGAVPYGCVSLSAHAQSLHDWR